MGKKGGGGYFKIGYTYKTFPQISFLEIIFTNSSLHYVNFKHANYKNTNAKFWYTFIEVTMLIQAQFQF